MAKKPIEDEFQAPPTWYTDPKTKMASKILKPESAQVLLTEPEPALAWMIEDLWTDASRGFVAGDPGTGKTWIALDMLISVATGGLCLNRYKPAYQAPVLLIEEEGSRVSLQRRLHAMARAKQLSPAALKSLFHMTRQAVNIPRDTSQILKFVKQEGVRFIVFDSLRAVHSCKENSSDDMAPILQAFTDICTEASCSILLIHHLSKTNGHELGKSIFERMRGTSSLWAWRDCIMAVEGEPESPTCKCTFQFRDAESPDPIEISRFVGATSGTVALEAHSLDDSQSVHAKMVEIEEFVRVKLTGATRNDICSNIEGRKAENLKVIKQMERLGRLLKMGSKMVVPVVPEPVGTGADFSN